jgi:Tol biopolymer transport system component
VVPESKPPPAEDDRLQSWKEIAAYLKHSERTVRRWEAKEGLPVHRHLHEQRGSVYAFRAELDAWREQRSRPPAAPQASDPAGQPRPGGRKKLWMLALPLVGGCLLVAFWLWPARGTEPTPVPLTTFQGNELDPAFSPDGSHIAFTWNGQRQDNYDIYVTPLARDRPVRITFDAAEEFGPAWSPDGRTIAYLRRKGDNRVEIMAVPASGGPSRTMTEFFYDPRTYVKFRTRFLAWRPGSRHLTVAGRNSADEPHALWVVDDDGNKRRLTTPPPALNTFGDLSPAYAPGGRGLLFTRGNTRFTSELHLLPLDDDGMSAGPPKLVVPGTSSANTPVWVDQKHIVFHRFYQTGLWTLSLHDGRLAPVGFARWWAEMPAFSPHGNRLAYAAGGQQFHIWNVDLDAPDRPQRAIASTHTDASPAISPDGRLLAFGSSRSGNNEVWVSGLEGENAVRVTSLQGRASGEPRWSHDGQWIAFESRKDGRADVFAIRSDGSGLRQLTTHPADDVSPSWSRDGAWIYYSSNRAGEWDVWKTHWETGREVRVTSGGGLGAAESPDGRYVYYVKPQFSTAYGFLWRALVRGGPEELVLNDFQMTYRGFSVVDGAVYFISDDKRQGSNSLFLLRLASGAVKRIMPLGALAFCPEITPDGRRMFYALAEEKGYDLITVAGFR